MQIHSKIYYWQILIFRNHCLRCNDCIRSRCNKYLSHCKYRTAWDLCACCRVCVKVRFEFWYSGSGTPPPLNVVNHVRRDLEKAVEEYGIMEVSAAQDYDVNQIRTQQNGNHQANASKMSNLGHKPITFLWKLQYCKCSIRTVKLNTFKSLRQWLLHILLDLFFQFK